MTQIRSQRRRVIAAASTALVGLTLAACGSSDGGGSASSGGEATATAVEEGLNVYFIPKDTQNPYTRLALDGGETALEELGGTVTISSGTEATAAAQIPSIQAAIQDQADAIVIAANDPQALCPTLQQADAAGIAVLAFDSDIQCDAFEHLFINQAETNEIGTSQVDLLVDYMGTDTGQIAILSAAASATNQNSWIAAMEPYIEENYPGLELVDTVYGNDDPATSLTVLQGLLSAYPDLKGIISPTTVGISTAAQYLSNNPDVASRITLTGLGLPSQMREYVDNGTVQGFELWNPNDLGYLAGYAAAALASGTTNLDEGATFEAGRLGEYTVLAPSGDVGPSVVLGPPTVFDASNIADFDF
jgi:rhamnose transport system substrate-binding protein